MNVAQIIQEKRDRCREINSELFGLYEDNAYADTRSQNAQRIYLLDCERRECEDTIRALTFEGPVAPAHIQAEHRSNQWFLREFERAAKRNALVDKALGALK